jgi:signal transduction histidine kinase
VTLRARVLLGAVLWTFGLFVLSGSVTTAIVEHHRRFANTLHGMFGHWLPAFTIAALCLVAGLWQVRRGLAPVHQLRERLGAVHRGVESRVNGSYPAEIQPLVDDLNALLVVQAETVRRAVARAGDLAHGLKTPLAVLSHEANAAAAAGNPQVAAAVTEQVERMRRQIDRHLAHARAAASGATADARTNVGDAAAALARTLQRLYADKSPHIEVQVPGDHDVRVHRHDLDEMLGNLLDNACKWASGRIRLGSTAATATITIVVEDDGPGIAAPLRDAVLRRGVRADEAAPGSGLGLAIVRDLAEVYGGRVALDSSPLGGVLACVELPRAS